MQTVRSVSWLAVLMLSAMAWNAAAAESTAPAQPLAKATTSTPSGHAAAKPTYVRGIGQSVDSALLAKSSGGTEVTENMTLTGTVSNNTSDHLVTGSNVIDSGSFNGAMGLPMVIQNTGNGVLIQNATILNVQFQP